MKRFYTLTVTFLFLGVSLNAQDRIFMRDGSVIEAQVTEVTPAEIRYRGFDNLDGPVTAIPASAVLSVWYATGRVEIIGAGGSGAAGSAVGGQETAAAREPRAGREPREREPRPTREPVDWEKNPGSTRLNTVGGSLSASFQAPLLPLRCRGRIPRGSLCFLISAWISVL